MGGYFDNTSASANEKHGAIRLYDYPSGKLLTILKSHTNVVLDLAFSPDGNYLASGSSDTTVKLWDISSLRGGTTKQSIEPLLTLFVGSDDEWVMWTPQGYYNASLKSQTLNTSLKIKLGITEHLPKRWSRARGESRYDGQRQDNRRWTKLLCE